MSLLPSSDPVWGRSIYRRQFHVQPLLGKSEWKEMPLSSFGLACALDECRFPEVSSRSTATDYRSHPMVTIMIADLSVTVANLSVTVDRGHQTAKHSPKLAEEDPKATAKRQRDGHKNREIPNDNTSRHRPPQKARRARSTGGRGHSR